MIKLDIKRFKVFKTDIGDFGISRYIRDFGRLSELYVIFAGI